ncbi:MAG: peptide chain release factor 1 [Armatimonadetes bacterium]|nr:peptide chain release factor 1 [Armatimonadota bacterium]
MIDVAALDAIEEEYHELERRLADPAVIGDQHLFRDTSIRHSELATAVEHVRAYRAALADAEEAEKGLADAADDEEREFYQEELESAQQRAQTAEAAVLAILVPKDEADEKHCIVEIRAGTGGEEAALFAADLLGMYSAYAERMRWKPEVLDSSPSGMGGYKEVVLAVNGKGAYGRLKSESGVHRVQRVPVTESQGRIHTSAATVAVLPEAEEVDVRIDPADCEVQTFGASGAGGQHVQKNDTAVRVRHKPSGLVVSCQNERSQHQNREQAFRILRSKLLDLQLATRREEEAAARRQHVKSGDRSDKLRTYNWPQDRLTDHRIGLTLHNLPSLLQGNIDELLDALAKADYERRLAEAAVGDSTAR